MREPAPSASDLLQPSLARVPGTAPLSPGATFATSFFGGPCAAAIVAAVNLRRLGRGRDAGLLLAAPVALAAAALALTAFAILHPEALARVLPAGIRVQTAVRRADNALGL